MFAIRLKPELEKELENLAKGTKRSKSYHAREALKKYIEDRSDYLKGLAILEKGGKTYTIEEAKEILGLANSNS